MIGSDTLSGRAPPLVAARGVLCLSNMCIGWGSVMAEVIVPVLIVGLRERCDLCRTGEMIHNGMRVVRGASVQYVHQCSNCLSKDVFDERYPSTRSTISPLPIS